MAKRKRIARHWDPQTGGNRQANADSSRQANTATLLTPERMMGVVAALMAAALVYAGFWPADSTEVQTGAARYLAGMLIIAGGIAVVVRPLWNEPGVDGSDRAIEVTAWGLALAMMLSTWANATQANLRLGFNEMWWWVAAAALLVAARRVCDRPDVVNVLFQLIAAITLGVAVFGWHQHWIGIPAMIEMFEADPDAMLRAAGIHADEGSSLRIVFYNRLYDGGPTGTFALANSMAAFLLLGLVVIGGMAFSQWSTMTTAQRGAWLVVIGVVGGMLLASRSRSAAGSLLIVILVAATRRWWDGRLVTIAKVAGGATLLLASLAAIGWQVGKHTEWIGQAPASLEVRLRYWIASVKMIAQAPWLGVGPGQFKARYERFRADVSTEQIADPHHWFWQIATTGGVIAAVIAIALIAAIVLRIRRGGVAPEAGTGSFVGVAIDHPSQVAVRSIWIAAAATLGWVWIGGALTSHVPTVDAGLVATVAGLAMLGLVRWSLSHRPAAQAVGQPIPCRAIAVYAILAVMIDLMAAGGIIVPGVAIPLWIAVAIATSPKIASPETGAPADSPVQPAVGRLAVAGVMTVLVVAWYLTAILPIEQAQAAKLRFATDWEQGRVEQAVISLRQATEADRWDAGSPMQLATVLAQLAVSDSVDRARWESELWQVESDALARIGHDPVSLRQLGDGQLRLYQRYGDPDALRKAEFYFESATQAAPAHESYAAQLAEIYRQRGDQRAYAWAQRAVTLSAAGGYYERSLPFVLVMPAEHFGDSVMESEIRRPASEVLPPLLSAQDSAINGADEILGK